jgi:RecA/RadA recombinase
MSQIDKANRAVTGLIEAARAVGEPALASWIERNGDKVAALILKLAPAPAAKAKKIPAWATKLAEEIAEAAISNSGPRYMSAIDKLHRGMAKARNEAREDIDTFLEDAKRKAVAAHEDNQRWRSLARNIPKGLEPVDYAAKLIAEGRTADFDALPADVQKEARERMAAGYYTNELELQRGANELMPIDRRKPTDTLATIARAEAAAEPGNGVPLRAGTPPVLSSGFPALDTALGIGGYPRGAVTQLYGRKIDAVTQIAAMAADGQPELWIDCTDPAEPRDVGSIFHKVDQALRGRKVAICVVSGIETHADQATTIASMMRRVVGIKHDAVVLFLSDSTMRELDALKMYASVRVEIGTPDGVQVPIKVVKNKFAPPFQHATITLGELPKLYKLPTYSEPEPAPAAPVDYKASQRRGLTEDALKEAQIAIGKIHRMPPHGRNDDSWEPASYFRIAEIDPNGFVVFEKWQADGSGPIRSSADIIYDHQGVEMFRAWKKLAEGLNGMDSPPKAVKLTDLTRNDGGDTKKRENLIIKQVLTAAAPSVKFAVRGGSGTSWGWSDVEAKGGTADDQKRAIGMIREMNIDGQATSLDRSFSFERHQVTVPDRWLHVVQGGEARRDEAKAERQRVADAARTRARTAQPEQGSAGLNVVADHDTSPVWRALMVETKVHDSGTSRWMRRSDLFPYGVTVRPGQEAGEARNVARAQINHRGGYVGKDDIRLIATPGDTVVAAPDLNALVELTAASNTGDRTAAAFARVRATLRPGAETYLKERKLWFSQSTSQGEATEAGIEALSDAGLLDQVRERRIELEEELRAPKPAPIVLPPRPAPRPAEPETELDLAFAPLELIPHQVAQDAHYGTSHLPEQRAVQEQRGFSQHVTAFRDQLRAAAQARGVDQAIADSEAARYRDNYADKYTALLRGRSGLMSTLVTGGSNFPVERMRKKSDAHDKRASEFHEWAKRAREAAMRTIRDAGVEAAGGAPVVARNELAEAKRLQAAMVAANKIVRLKISDEEKLQRIMALGLSERTARDVLVPDFAGRLGFPAYALQNNLATIKRLEARAGTLEQRAEREAQEIPFEGGTIELDPDDDRLRIHFNGRPDAEMTTKLKGSGFKWSPSNTAWQRQWTENAEAAAERLLGVAIRAGTPGSARRAALHAADEPPASDPDEEPAPAPAPVAQEPAGAVEPPPSPGYTVEPCARPDGRPGQVWCLRIPGDDKARWFMTEARAHEKAAELLAGTPRPARAKHPPTATRAQIREATVAMEQAAREAARWTPEWARRQVEAKLPRPEATKLASRAWDRGQALIEANSDDATRVGLENTARRAGMAGSRREHAGQKVAWGRRLVKLSEAIRNGYEPDGFDLAMLTSYVSEFAQRIWKQNKDLGDDALKVDGYKGEGVWTWKFTPVTCFSSDLAKAYPKIDAALRKHGRIDPSRDHCIDVLATDDAVEDIAAAVRAAKVPSYIRHNGDLQDLRARLALGFFEQADHTRIARRFQAFRELTGEDFKQAPKWAPPVRGLSTDPFEDRMREAVDLESRRWKDPSHSQIPGYFPTPYPEVEEMIERAELAPGMTVLEPSAGSGGIADRLPRDVSITVAEKNHTLREILKLKGYDPLIDALNIPGQYDRILMNPPFEGGQDMAHVMHAFEHNLKPGGRLVAIVGAGAMQNYRNARFQQLVEEHRVGIDRWIAPEAWKRSGTAVNAVMITLEKPR